MSQVERFLAGWKDKVDSALIDNFLQRIDPR
jgi:hypothetical protein